MKYGIKAIVIYSTEYIYSCFQMGTPWADGTASISQCAINPGETYNYRFKVDKVKTYSISVFFFFCSLGLEIKYDVQFIYKIYWCMQPGTYFYHGHLGMQRSAGLYGSLIVDLAEGEKEPFYYDGELNLLLSDWWHKNTHDQEIGLFTNPFRWVGESQVKLVYESVMGDFFFFFSFRTSLFFFERCYHNAQAG